MWVWWLTNNLLPRKSKGSLLPIVKIVTPSRPKIVMVAMEIKPTGKQQFRVAEEESKEYVAAAYTVMMAVRAGST